jgi:hypothetical protein
MDVWSCIGCRGHQPRGNRAQNEILINRNARSPERALRPCRFLLTVD